jgi:NAD(P)-dependent dehydrogenase (short-subunit alcohol dehydrogenase family)
MADLHDLNGKTCIVTDATSGIGKATALELARMGGTVVLICRNRQKGEEVVREIRAITQSTAIDLLIADLSSQQQIRAAATEFTRKYERLHVLINNAGALFCKRSESVDGIEMTLAVNHLAPFLLTNLLLDTLKTTGSARIVNVNSDAHEHGKIDFSDLQMRRHYGRGVGMRAYGNAKLSNLLTVYELARRLHGTQVTVNALHPGYVATNIISFESAAGALRLLKPLWSIAKHFILTPEKGATTSIYLACSPQVSSQSGKYFERCASVPSSATSYDRNMQMRMWEISEELTTSSSIPCDFHR